jgi:[ribosomal protein S5]-alanine N-acetyltransferase
MKRSGKPLRTERLELVPATGDLLDAALVSPAALSAGLDAEVPPTWPPDLLDRPALEFVRDLVAVNPEASAWWMYFVVLPLETGERTLIGSIGYKGPPSTEGAVEVGYGIVSDHQRRGYATEAVRALVTNAFAVPEVNRVIAETLPELTPSIGVLRKCGFELTGEGSEPGVIRFELTRRAHEAED